MIDLFKMPRLQYLGNVSCDFLFSSLKTMHLIPCELIEKSIENRVVLLSILFTKFE